MEPWIEIATIFISTIAIVGHKEPYFTISLLTLGLSVGRLAGLYL